MTNQKRGFTLIELLVVVLIIGILAAVAVPQYQVAVEKARAVEAITQIRALMNAQEAYRLATGGYSETFDKLDFSFEGTLNNNKTVFSQKNWTVSLVNISQPIVYAWRNKEAKKGRYFIQGWLSNGQIYCTAYLEDTVSTRVCKTFGVGQQCPWSTEETTALCYQI